MKDFLFAPVSQMLFTAPQFHLQSLGATTHVFATFSDGRVHPSFLPHSKTNNKHKQEMCAKWLFVRFGHKRFVCMVFGVILGSPWFPKNSKSGINLFGTFWDCSERFGASLVSKAVFPCATCFLYDSFPVFKTGALDWCLSFGVWSFPVDSWGKKS